LSVRSIALRIERHYVGVYGESHDLTPKKSGLSNWFRLALAVTTHFDEYRQTMEPIVPSPQKTKAPINGALGGNFFVTRQLLTSDQALLHI
jgi:hypothetical protein